MLNYHSLAKLREHTDTTRRIFKHAITLLGRSMRKFVRISANVDTYELPSEEAARGRRDVALATKGKGSKRTREGEVIKKRKQLNLKRPKWHLIGHYPEDILDIGPTDCYSTQTVSDSRVLIQLCYVMVYVA